MSTVANKRVTRKHDARRRHVRELVWAAVLAVVLLLLLVNFDPTVGTIGASAGSGGASLGSSAPFTIAGSAAGPISPGAKAPLDLKLTNPHDSSMSVTDLRVRVQKVSAPNADETHPCAVGDFAVDQASNDLSVTVPARATSTLSSLGLPRATLPHVGMLNRPTNQDGCKEASLTLAYTATGTLEG